MISHLRRRRDASRGRKGQALIEIYFVVVLMLFIAVTLYEISIMYHNFNVVNNALKQAAWLASLGAPNEDIFAAVANADDQMGGSAFLGHYTKNFGLSVWVPMNGKEVEIAPNSSSKDVYFSGGQPNVAAYLYRAADNNVRVGFTYVVGISMMFFGTDPVFKVELPLTESMSIMAQNDEDWDGLVDLYEPELFRCIRNEDTWVAVSHRDNAISDKASTNIDGDTNTDDVEASFSIYDYDNDQWMDRNDNDTNLMRHPIIGGRKVVLP